MRRRNNNSMSKIVFIVIGVIVLFIIAAKIFMGGSSNNEYTKYVVKFASALEEYADKELPANYSPVIYEYDEIKEKLISAGYLQEFGNTEVTVTSNPITISKENYDVVFYNYNNPTTLENRFELKFRRGNIEQTCTKVECK